jgi:NAD(P)H dehydrogenase (quinone)
VLLDPAPHAGATYSLTGPEALTLDDVVAVLAVELGRSVRYHDETVEEAYASRASYGAPDWQLDAWVSAYAAIAGGEVGVVTDDVRRLSGRPPDRRCRSRVRSASGRPSTFCWQASAVRSRRPSGEAA